MGIFSMIRILLLCAASLTILLANPSSAQCNNHLLAGESLVAGQSLTYDSFIFTMQYDCNLVLYGSKRAIWASGTNGKGTGCFVTMQNDGNLVVYDSSNKAVWSSKTNRENGNYILILQKDRNVVIYSRPLWATGTNLVGSASVIVAGAHNGSVGISGAEQNKVKEMWKIVQVVGDE